MMAGAGPRPLRVSLLSQAGAKPPAAALARLNVAIPASPTAVIAAADKPIQQSRNEFLRLLSLARAGRHAELDLLLHTLVRNAVRLGRGAERNRSLFLMAVLSADEDCAEALGRQVSVGGRLCHLLTLEGSPDDAGSASSSSASASPLSATEQHWVLLTLSEMAARPAAA